MVECSWCGEKIEDNDPVLIRKDAMGNVHYFHGGCWDEHVQIFGEKSL